MEDQLISVTTRVQAPIDKAWKYWTTPEHIKQWDNASPEWHTPVAENDLRKKGKFLYRMEAKDGSAGFDFEGIYDEVVPHRSIAYTLADGRKVTVDFLREGNYVTIHESFKAEDLNSVEMQREGWQAILDQFRYYVEKH